MASSSVWAIDIGVNALKALRLSNSSGGVEVDAVLMTPA